MSNQSTNARRASVELLGAREPATEQQSSEDFSLLIWREIFRTIVRKEKMAIDRCETVTFDIEVMEREVLLTVEERSIIKLQFECEPGKPPRLLSPPMLQCSSPERIANENKKVRPKKL